jgi:hypothetical protein
MSWQMVASALAPVDAPSGGLVHFAPDIYLDARRPEWAVLETGGAIRYHAGLRWVLVQAAHMDVVGAIRSAQAEGRA